MPEIITAAIRFPGPPPAADDDPPQCRTCGSLHPLVRRLLHSRVDPGVMMTINGIAETLTQRVWKQ